MSKPNNNVVEQIHKLSQLDGQEVLKDVHSYPGHYLRVRDANTEVDRDFDTFGVSYNNNNLPIEICYYKGASPHITEIAFTSDSSGSLNNKYFIIYSSKSGKAYHVWYNVNNSGTDPNPGNSQGIEVQINTNEPAVTVAEATLLTIKAFIPNNYTLRRKNTVLTITNLVYGELSNTIDATTGFLINNISGSFEEVEKILIEYDNNGNPIYKGNTLYGYKFNVVTGQFELNTVEDTTVNKTYTVQYNEIIAVASGINSIIDSFTATQDETFIKNVYVSGCNIGEYTLELNSTVIDKKLTYFGGSLNEKFEFEGNDGLILSNGDVLQVKVIHNRPQVGNFNSRIDILE